MKTIVGVFDTFDEAKKAGMDLEKMGLAHNDISIVANNEGGAYAANETTTTDGTTTNTGHAIGHDATVGAGIGAVSGFLVGITALAIPGLGWFAAAGWFAATLGGAATGAIAGGLIGALTHVGVPADDAAHYNEAVKHGGVMLAVRAEDSQASGVAQILGDDGAINIDERMEQYKASGYVPGAATMTAAPAMTAAPIMPATTTNMTATPPVAAKSVNAQGEQTLNVVEESLEVGKRQVQSGGVRVYSHVTEKPVEASVNLREEHVTVERHAVNLPADASAFNTVKEGVIEVTEMAEVPVVAKEARIVEEVSVGKVATERTETVHDTVRRTDVEVEQIAGQATTTGVTGMTGTTGMTGSIPGVQTGGHAVDGSGAPDTRGITEKVADTLTGNRVDDKTGRPV